MKESAQPTMKEKIGNVPEMAFFGDPKVIANFMKKKELLIENDPSHRQIKIALVLPGGGQACIYQAGFCTYLEDEGYTDAIDDIYANSGGSIIGWNLVGKGMRKNAPLIYEDNVEEEFFKVTRGKKAFDVPGLTDRLLEKRSVDPEIVKNAHTKLHVGVTDASTGDYSMLEVTQYKNPFSGVVASYAIPFIGNNKGVMINGKRYIDGDFGNPLPYHYAIDSDATDIIICMSTPFSYQKEIPESVARYLPPLIRNAVLIPNKMNQNIGSLLEKINIPPKVRVAIFAPATNIIKPWCMNASLLVQARDAGYRSISSKMRNLMDILD